MIKIRTEKIKQLMKEKGVNQSSLARSLGVTRQTVYEQLKDWEQDTEPRISTLKKWAIALDVDLQFLLELM